MPGIHWPHVETNPVREMRCDQALTHPYASTIVEEAGLIVKPDRLLRNFMQEGHSKTYGN